MQRREVRVVEAETRAASPFARSLVFAYVAAFLYEGDAPLAERKAQALTLDRNLLRELLGRRSCATCSTRSRSTRSRPSSRASPVLPGPVLARR